MQNNFVVYKSSAGSGKTFTLVKEYLKIVLSDKTKVKNVLAITFTNAAAAEMKQRIIEALADLSGLKDKKQEEWPQKIINLKKVIEEEANLTTEQIINNAGDVLSFILHNYGDFAVSTIDSFTYRIIRTFAFDLQIPLNFDIELDSKHLLSQAIDILISRVGNENEELLTKLMLAFMERMTDDEKKLSPEKEILKLAQVIHEEDVNNNIQKIQDIGLDDFLNIQTEIVKRIKAFENDIQDIASKVVSALNKENITDSAFYQKSKGISVYFRNLAAGKITDKITPNSFVEKTINEDNWFSKDASEDEKTSIEFLKPIIIDAYFLIREKADNKMPDYLLLKLVNKNIFPLAVLNEVERVLNDIKGENSLLHISDFNKKIAEIVSLQPVPFIYERLGEKYQHYMIDEFQDTSLLQWQNLLPLVENALANANMNLVVGDCKQAIYRWRGGEVEQFAILPEIPEEIKAVSRPSWEFALKNYYFEKKLETNYRSYTEIVNFNNAFFKFIKENVLPEDLKNIYDGCRQMPLENKQGGYVHLEFVDENNESHDSDKKEITLKRILEIIEELKHDLKHNLSDITILCRSNDEANLTAKYLLEHKIDVISSESLLLSFSADVNFFISFLKLLIRPDDNVAFSEVVNYLAAEGHLAKIENIHDAFKELDVFTLKKIRNKTIHLQKLEALLAKNDYNLSFNYLKKLNLWDVCEYIVRLFFSAKDEVSPFIAFFMDAVYDFLDKNPSTIDGFLEWWEDVKNDYSVILPEGVEAVQVKTIHKAKGLQFPVVIYPFAKQKNSSTTVKGFWASLDDSVVPGLNTAYITYETAMQDTCLEDFYNKEKEKSLLDLLNLVYVAFTRPVEKLFVLSSLPKNEKFKENTVPGFLNSFLVDKQLWQEGVKLYTFGQNFTGKQNLSKDNDNISPDFDVALKDYISNDWRNRIRVKPGVKTLAAGNEAMLALSRGKLMHKVMENIFYVEDVDFVLNQMLINGEISVEEKQVLYANINGLINSPELSSWFKKGVVVKNEADIMNEKGDFFRPDRVVLAENKTAVIDYKTGNPSEFYKKQIYRYKELLTRMGYANISAFLVYLDQNKIEKVE
ncbi:MAG: UvrD-helicase domain-containing protein [Bacteroidales bacterium]